MNAVPVGAKACNVTCPSCKATVITKIDRRSTIKTHLMACLLCHCGCLFCMCAPYCMNSCRNADHYCPNCDAYLGTYKR